MTQEGRGKHRKLRKLRASGHPGFRCPAGKCRKNSGSMKDLLKHFAASHRGKTFPEDYTVTHEIEDMAEAVEGAENELRGNSSAARGTKSQPAFALVGETGAARQQTPPYINVTARNGEKLILSIDLATPDPRTKCSNCSTPGAIPIVGLCTTCHTGWGDGFFKAQRKAAAKSAHTYKSPTAPTTQPTGTPPLAPMEDSDDPTAAANPFGDIRAEILHYGYPGI